MTYNFQSLRMWRAGWLGVLIAVLPAVFAPEAFSQTPLTAVEYGITSTGMQVTPAVLSVPKGIAGSVLPLITSGGSTNNAAVAQLTAGAYVQATLRGPSLPTPQRIVAAPNSPLLLPPLNLVGDYQLDNIALVDAATGKTRMEASPSTVPVHVFDQLLISSVTSQPLTIDQIQQKGIAIDDSNFRAVEFNISFVVDGKTIPVSFPVVSPKFTDSTELIPAAEVEARLKEAAALNQQISSTMVQLPPELQTASLNIQIQGINFQAVDPTAEHSLALTIPPIPALMVIPGNIGYLHQFFSVKIFTENGAPPGSGLSVDNLQATLQLPAGPDGIASTDYAQPGDDPLRFARIGPNKIIQPVQPVKDPGPDGQLGTGDDISRLQPGETGQGEFLVEGLQQGLQVMNINLTGDLYGLVAGAVHIQGKAAGSVLVRNPTFSITFTHPNTVRVGEPYTASITVLNTGVTPANLVQISLNKNSISGAMLDAGQAETTQLGTILPGRTATAIYHMVAQRTGQITFSDLTTGDDSVTGRFRFTMGVTAQGVPLSPDTIAMPDYVNYLPANLVAAANRVLGQALSIATAAQLPPGIVTVNNSIITRRVLDLAEAGQRVQYGDPLSRVLPDLLRDWEGGRQADAGFDSLLRSSDAGLDWRSAIFAAMEVDNLDGTQRLLASAPDLAGLGQSFVLASAGPGQMNLNYTDTTNSATLDGSTQPYAMVYGGTNGEWAVTPVVSNAVITWTFTNGPPTADMAVLLVGTNGQAQQLRWQITSPPSSAIYRFALNDADQRLQVDFDGSGTVGSALTPNQLLINELPPRLVAVQQDLSIVAGRPGNPCGGPPFYNYGTVMAVLYSKPMTQATAGATNSYVVEGNNGANSVQIQPSGRVALMNLRKGISAIIPRKLMVNGVTDVRGNPLVASPTLIQSVYPGTTNLFTGGVAVTGRVLKGDGSPVAGVPVTLTMYDGMARDTGCESWTRRVSQVLTDSGGNFDFDYVMSGIPYSVSASDTSDISPEALQLIMQSTIAGKPDSQQLEQLISASSSPNSLLALLSVGSLPKAIALVEGLDRALINDVVGLGSGREGQTVPIVLRFRGRATVTGQIVASDGVSPLPNAAVNLFPDPSSRELGRGVFSDGAGQFIFPGVPLGVFSVQVATSDKRGATVLGVLDIPNQTTNLVIAVPDQPMVYADLRGQVFDSDNLTPVPHARIFIGQYDPGASLIRKVMAIVDADENGIWEATNVPIKNIDIAAVSFDGNRKGVRTGINPVANTPTYVNIALEAATTVYGRVQFDDGRPATNALVAGGAALVRSDSLGNFQLAGVPVGSSTISAGLEKNPAAGIEFTRLGSTQVNVVEGAANYVVVKLRAAGRIFGKVFDAQGNLQKSIRVAIPQDGGFYWTDSDTNGNYVFENIGLGNYTVSAPANAVAPQLDVGKLGQQISSGDEDKILAAFKEAVTVFVGSEDPLINGEGLNFHPSAWGYSTTRLYFDGQNANADVRFIPQGSISGTVKNGQGVPIGAAVRLTGLGPDETGAPVTAVRGDVNSDPATGFFSFPNVLLAGPWGLQAASPFYPVVIKTNGFTTPLDPDVTGVTLQFPPVNDVNGRIAGHVFNPDGSLVNGGAQVHINVSADYQIVTDTNGFFDTQTKFPAVGVSYLVEVFDPATGLKGRAGVGMTPGITNFVDVHLLSHDSAVQVTVLRANGQPAAGAQLELDQGTYPNDAPLYAITDTNGLASFTGLWEGRYSVVAQYTESSTRLFARGGVTVGAGQTGQLTLRMGATGTIQGQFVKSDRITPVLGAEVTIGNLGFAATDTNGFFNFDGVPLGTYTVTGSDPVTGANAIASATMSYNAQTQTVQLVESTLGAVSGLVRDSYNASFVPNVTVRISFSDGLTPSRTVTTGPAGGFSFPGSPLGAFNLSASYVVPGAVGLTVSGQAQGILSAINSDISVNIQLQPLSLLAVHVVQKDGITPAQNTRVSVGGATQDTSTTGDVLFSNLRVPGNFTITAISQAGGDQFDGTQTNVLLTGNATNATVTLMLPGTGNVAGTVVGSDGTSPVENAEITLQFQSSLFSGQKVTALTDAQGRFAFSGVPLGSFLVTAASQSLAASENGLLNNAAETNLVSLRLGASGALKGIMVRADGITPVGGVDLALDYMSQSDNAGRAVFHTASDGAFRFDNIPVGAIHVSSAAPAFGGIINFNTALSANGQLLDLGAVPFDEALPQVVQVTPADTTVQVPITNDVELVFSEALDTNSIHANGIFIRGTNGANIDATVTLRPDTNGVQRLVRILPNTPLQSLQTYTVFVLAGDLPGAAGGILGSGPRDLVGRAMAAPFASRFTTADNTPPLLLSIFPSNNAVQIDPSSVPRLTFNKTLNSAGTIFTLTGPGGPVTGTLGVGLNGQVMTFLPKANLSANTRYSLVVSNVFDLAGNAAVGQPFTANFTTLDTIGPAIASLLIVSNQPPTAGAMVAVEALLTTNEPGASVRFTQDFNPIGTATNSPYRMLVKLPSSGSTTVRAIATDQYGNDGQFVQLVINVQTPQPPTLQFALISPTNAPVANGASVTVAVTVTGDAGIANLTAVIGGAASGPLIVTNGNQVLVQGIVATNASPDQLIQVFAQATDDLGFTSGQQVFNLAISDATAPGLTIFSPPDNAHLATGSAFNLGTLVSDNSSNVNLRFVISGSLSLTQNVTLALNPNVPATNIFNVPLTAAPTNGGLITATVSATDAATNLTTVTRNLWLPNTPGPEIFSLVIASNQPPVGGRTVPIEAVLAASQPGVAVRFTQDGSLVGIVTNAPYRVLIPLPAIGNTVIEAVATDSFGNVGVLAQLVIAVQPNVPPSVQFVRVSPLSGPVLSGSNFVVNVVAAGNSNLFNITATIGGAASDLSVQTNGSTLRLQGFVPANTVAGQQVQITAQAVDGLGQSTGPQLLSLPVSDGTSPDLVILSPGPNAQLVPNQPLPITVQVTDNSTHVTLGLSVTGAVTATQTVPVTLTPNMPFTNVFNIPLPDAPTNGSPVIATVTATDVANNVTTLARIFWLPGTETTITWNRQALGQKLTCTNGGSIYTWPNNNNWSQSAIFGDPCSSGNLVLIQPSNWSTTNYPNGTNLDVILGSLGGAPANLNVSVNLRSLTIQSDGGLNMANNTSLTAVNYDFQGGSGITRNGSGNTLVLNGGTMSKSDGTNVFTIDKAIAVNSVNGAFVVEKGALALGGNGSYYTNGGFTVSSDAVLVLAPVGQTVTMAGTFVGAGAGSVVFSNATLTPGAGGVNFNLPASLFNWSGVTLANDNPVTNSGVLTLSGLNNATLQRSAVVNNGGVIHHTGAGRMSLQLNARINNLAAGIYNLESDGGIFTDDYTPQYFDNYGTFRKSGGVSNSVVATVLFNNMGGTVDVASGTLTLANSGVSSNGVITVAAGAKLDLTGGQQPTWAGLLQGSGAGRIEVSGGTLISSPGLVLDCVAGLFYWNGGSMRGVITNRNNLTISTTGDVVSERNGQFNNAGIVHHSSSGRLNLYQNAKFENLASGVYDFESGGSIGTSDYQPQYFDNYGTFRKSGGVSNSVVATVLFNNMGGTVDVASGTLTLANSGVSSNGVITVAAGAKLDLTGGQQPTWAGLLQGSGAGRIEVSGGTLISSPGLVLDCVAGLFYWNGGSMRGVITNRNNLTISTTGDVVSERNGQFNNAGIVHHSSNGRLNLYQNAKFENLASGVYDFKSDGSIGTSDYTPQYFDNYGVFRKSGGVSNSVVASVLFNNLGGTVDVASGTLTLANSGVSSNGVITVAAGAKLDVTGGQSPTWNGMMQGSGAGKVMLSGGTLNVNSTVLNFPDGMFQWSGGRLVGTVTNVNVVTLSGLNASVVERAGQFNNVSVVRQSGTGALNLHYTAQFENLATGTYELASDAGIFTDDYTPQYFDNYGVFRKSGGVSNSVVASVLFNNLGGTVDVASGTLTLANSGVSSNGVITVAAGAKLDVTGGQSPTWNGMMQGSGAGKVMLSGGTLNVNSTVLNFPDGMFQWSGGRLVGTVTNVNVVTLSGLNASVVERAGQFNNVSVVRQSGTGALNLHYTAQFENLATGTYELASDAGIFTDDYTPQYFDNYGTFRKSGGTNTSTISVTFNNQNGSIEVDSGILNLGNNNYVQGAGAFTVQLGGTNSGQFGQLNVAKAALSGPLNVKLTDGYSPALGDKYQILACANYTGIFSGLALPGGISVNYSNNGVFLIVTGAVTILPPAIVLQPGNVTNVAGGTAMFHVNVSGSAPLGFKWQFNGNNLTNDDRISGSQSDALLVAKLSPADVGSYQVVVTNSAGSIASQPASLNLLSIPSYSYLVTATPNLLGYWQFTPALQANSTVGDITGIFAGNAAVGPAGSGPDLPDQSGNTAAVLDGNGDYVSTSLVGGLSTNGLYANQGSIIGWFRLGTLPSVAGRTFTIAGESLSGNDFDLQIGTDNKIKFYTESGGATIDDTALTVNDTNVWHFIAATFAANASRNLYLDGALVAGSVPGNHDSTRGGSFAMGESQVFNSRFFQGALDEIAVFNRQLTAGEITSFYAASKFNLFPLQIQPAGANVILTWSVPATTTSLKANAAIVAAVPALDYSLETSTSLEPDAVWLPYTNIPVINPDGAFQLTFPVTNSAQFFRLRHK